MARKQVVEVQCSRCERTEYQDSGTAAGEGPVFVAEYQAPGTKAALTIRLDDLCSPCARSVKALVEQIGKRLDGVSPDRVKKEEVPAPAKAEAKKEAQPPNGGAAPAHHAPAVAVKNPATTRSS